MNHTGAIPLFSLLRQMNPDVARNYQWDRWINKTAGKDFNVPEPPKNAKREYYKRLEEEQYEKNKIAYQKRNGISNW